MDAKSVFVLFIFLFCFLWSLVYKTTYAVASQALPRWFKDISMRCLPVGWLITVTCATKQHEPLASFPATGVHRP